MRARIVDVSDLPPPEPMQVAIAELQRLAADEYLVLAHRREPHPLYTLLATMGYRHRTRRGRATAFEVLIWRGDDAPPEDA